MRHTTSVRRVFEAGHHVPGHSICGWQHGHRWTITATVAGGLDPKKVLVVDHGDLRRALDRICDEVADRDLNVMLPGIVSTPEGIALYIAERLTLDWPGLTAIQVEMGESVTATITMESR